MSRNSLSQFKRAREMKDKEEYEDNRLGRLGKVGKDFVAGEKLYQPETQQTIKEWVNRAKLMMAGEDHFQTITEERVYLSRLIEYSDGTTEVKQGIPLKQFRKVLNEHQRRLRRKKLLHG